MTAPPEPVAAGALDALIECLRLLKAWAGNPSYDTITSRINEDWTASGRPHGERARRATVADCFRAGRKRLNPDLVIAVAWALHPDPGYVAQWRQALRVAAAEVDAAAQVRVQDGLPPEPAGFTGRLAELSRLRAALEAGDPAVVSGMAGVGKTRLAVHIGHELDRERPFDRILFVNLRGFHPDPAQPPADPGAVLDGFLRLLGVPGHRIPHDPEARAAAYRARLAGIRALVVLDNAADADQIRPLLPRTPGCLTLVTSRHSLTELDSATHLTVDVFSPDEALALLRRAARRTPVGADRHAPERIARRCGRLPLALGLVIGHMRTTPGWTLTDHADRLDERHRDHRLDGGVELALDLSYRHLSPSQRRLLRRLALDPGQDLDAHAAAALTGADLPSTRQDLRQLRRDHLVHQAIPGRYGLHDLIRVHAANRATDEDSRSDRRAARTRLFDYYLATAAIAVGALFPAEANHGSAGGPAVAALPPVTGAAAARRWLDVERPTLVSVAAYTANHGWPGHVIRLSTTLLRYLDGGYHGDAMTVHGHAVRAARHANDRTGQANALTNLGSAHRNLGRHGAAADHFREALELFRRAGDESGQARAHGNLGLVEERLGRYRSAADHSERALRLFRRTGNRAGEARALINLGIVEGRLGRHEFAAGRLRQALYGALGVPEADRIRVQLAS